MEVMPRQQLSAGHASRGAQPAADAQERYLGVLETLRTGDETAAALLY